MRGEAAKMEDGGWRMVQRGTGEGEGKAASVPPQSIPAREREPQSIPAREREPQSIPDLSADVWTGEAWWRHDGRMEGWERALVGACLRAHAGCVVRRRSTSPRPSPQSGEGEELAPSGEGEERGEGMLPCSSAGVLNGWHGSRDYVKAIASGLMTLGAVHGPIEGAYGIVSRGGDVTAYVRGLVTRGQRVPGWGNGFVKGGPDAGWAEVEGLLPDWYRGHLAEITAVIHACGKRVWLNPAGYSAAVAHVVGMPGRVAGWLLVAGRLTRWSELIFKRGGGR